MPYNFSEPTGSANRWDEGGKGIQTTATLVERAKEWVVDGEKV